MESSVASASTHPPRLAGPTSRGGHAVWSGRMGEAEVRFVGRGVGGSRSEIFARATGLELPVAWAKQVHGDRVLPADEGFCGEGDALWTARPGLVLSIATADCVPIALAGPGVVAAVHAGWHGLVAGIIPHAVATLAGERGIGPERLRAWVGPTIGACCYEVGADVAEQVAAASSAAVVTPGELWGCGGARGLAPNPHLDLVAAARFQLVRAGVPEPRALVRCTRCDERTLWSYRREGPRAGRNVAFIWRPTEPDGARRGTPSDRG